MGIELREGIPCFDGICKFRDEIQQYDKPFIAFAIGLPILSYILQALGNHWIRKKRREQQAQDKIDLMSTRNKEGE